MRPCALVPQDHPKLPGFYQLPSDLRGSLAEFTLRCESRVKQSVRRTTRTNLDSSGFISAGRLLARVYPRLWSRNSARLLTPPCGCLKHLHVWHNKVAYLFVLEGEWGGCKHWVMLTLLRGMRMCVYVCVCLCTLLGVDWLELLALRCLTRGISLLVFVLYE